MIFIKVKKKGMWFCICCQNKERIQYLLSEIKNYFSFLNVFKNVSLQNVLVYNQALKVKWFPLFALDSIYFHKISVYCTNYNCVSLLEKGKRHLFSSLAMINMFWRQEKSLVTPSASALVFKLLFYNYW